MAAMNPLSKIYTDGQHSLVPSNKQIRLYINTWAYMKLYLISLVHLLYNMICADLSQLAGAK